MATKFESIVVVAAFQFPKNISEAIMRGLSSNDLEALSSEADNRCNDNRTAILIEGCLKK